MREIPLTQGQVSLVNDGDYDWLLQWKWQAKQSHGTWYAVHTSSKSEGGPKRTVLMHREILGNPPEQVDHINGNGLDNQRSNLREATCSQNSRNRHKIWGSSQYKGVSWRLDKRKWHAQILVNCLKVHLGYHDNEVDAARAYDKAALEHFGEFANPNFQTSNSSSLEES